MTLDLTGTEGKETLLGGHVTGSFSCEEQDRRGKIFRLRTWNSKCEKDDGRK